MDREEVLSRGEVSARRLFSRILRAGVMGAIAAGILAMGVGVQQASAQGCVAAHTTEPTMDLLGVGGHSDGGSGNWLHRLTVGVDYRVYNSWRHYIGDVEQTQREELHNAIVNHVNLLNLAVNYQLSPRWSLNASIPALLATRHGQAQQGGYYRVDGIGDMQIGAQMWVIRPPAENGGNVAISMAVKLPTGANDAAGRNATGKIQTADQSIQAGDGSWGFTLATQAYKRIPGNTMSYLQGSWLFNPRDTNGVPTYRPRLHEEIMSVPDQYLLRGGLSHNVPKLRHVALSGGMRVEGIPAHDLLGDSNGFRRPGYIVSFEPGLLITYKRSTLSILGPWAVHRDRTVSTSDKLNNTHGDAAFADYSVSISLLHHF